MEPDSSRQEHQAGMEHSVVADSIQRDHSLVFDGLIVGSFDDNHLVVAGSLPGVDRTAMLMASIRAFGRRGCLDSPNYSGALNL
jgi:hypothetical protein